MQTISRSVKIGPNFFAGAFRDYSNWHWAYAREICQNGIDTPKCTKIDVKIRLLGDNTFISITNNGIPMTEDILCNKLLSLGESGKGFQNTVGGFGKAKEILMMAHTTWSVKTGNLEAYGAGGDYELTTDLPYFHGTTTAVEMKGDQSDSLIGAFRNFAKYSQWSGTLTLNGDVLETNLHKGSRRQEFPWGVVYTNNTFSNKLICRINGIPMFNHHVNHKGTVVIELVGQSGDLLNSNRDSLKYNIQAELNKFITDLSMNSKAAFKSKQMTKVKFAGYKLAGISGTDVEITTDKETNVGSSICVNTEVVSQALRSAEAVHEESVKTTEAYYNYTFIRPEFYLRSEINGTIPKKYMPDSFSTNSKQVINTWISLLVELAGLVKLNKTFSVGFIFDDNALAMHELENGKHVMYINPAKIVKEDGKPRQFLNRWNASDKWDMVATAAHEIVHLEGHSYHDEEFASRLTQVIGLVLANRNKIVKQFKAKQSF
jgi:hypothetical protein